MTKIVINNCYGGFSLSKECIERMFQIKGKKVWVEEDTRYRSLGLVTVWTVPPEERIEVLEGDAYRNLTKTQLQEYNSKYLEQTWYDREIDRADPALVQAVEELGDAAGGSYAELKVVEIPDDVDWMIQEYDGMEHIAERHRTWC